MLPSGPHKRRTTWLKMFIAFLVPAVVINEFLVYWVQCYRWPVMPSVDNAGVQYQTILLVADPQIQGYQDEPSFPVGTLARWDIDRYLQKTFSYACQHVQPDIVVFLGDLMDEGSKATDREYLTTLDRLHQVFRTAKFIKKIYIPGDNDIGGEGRDFLTKRKVTRYEQHFGNITSITKFSFIDFITLDVHAHGSLEDKVKAAEVLQQRQMSPVTILLNHETLMSSPKYLIHPITKKLRPQLIFSAHWHMSEIFTCDDCLVDNEYSWTVRRNSLAAMDAFLTLDLNSAYYLCEIAVPTCSYRMGQSNMGYGVAIIGSDKSLQYTVLWLPRRYTMLLGYVVVIVIYSIVYILNHCSLSRRR